MRKDPASGMPLHGKGQILPFPVRDRDISPGIFEEFLAWLAPDRDDAGKKYEGIRLRLIKLFTCRGCNCSEDLADETINRVILKVREIRDGYRGDPGPYFGGVARNVFHEYTRRRSETTPRPEPAPPEAGGRELDCLEQCLGALPATSRELILQYYSGDQRSRIRHRAAVAQFMEIGPNALRIRAHRIRTHLQRCVCDCLLD